jgi:stage II sporulation protein D
MKKQRLWQAALLVFGTLAPLWAQDFRVELFSKSLAREVRVRAESAPVRLCPAPRQSACLVLQPGTTARCVSFENDLRCIAGSRVQRFKRLSARSASPFLLQTARAGVRQDEGLRGMMVRGAEARAAGNGVRIVARVDLETYVAGVLAGEGATLRSPPAVAAMAVVARTWALRSRGRHRAQGFDFCSLTHCQFFRPPLDLQGKPSPALTAALRETDGLVLKYDGELIEPFYTGNCGGVTEAAADVWPDRAAPYLPSVKDPYCARSQQSSWQRELPLTTVSGILRERLGVSLHSTLRELMVEERTESGRARTLRVVGGSPARIDANRFRYVLNRQLGWNTLKSNLYTIERRGDRLLFQGRGLGHGVGLCQAGAEQMGQMGIAYQKILAQYFPGAVLAALQAPLAPQILSSEHFELVFPPGQQPWVSEALQALEAARRTLGKRARLLPAHVRVRTWETTEEFIRASGQPGWVAASNDGRAIALQPLRTLARRGILASTLRHEVTHLAVHKLRAPEVPRWYEEGLVLYLTGERVNASAAGGSTGRSLEESVSRPRSEAEMKAAYARALERVRGLARRRGPGALWQVLEHPGAEDVRWLNEP